MKNHKRYIPILRWKAAEKGALQKLYSTHKAIITPVIEFIMQQPEDKNHIKMPKQLLEESKVMFLKATEHIADQITKYWGREMVFVDLQLIDHSIRAEAFKKILEGGKQLNLFLVPVIRIIPVVGFTSDEQTRRMAVEYAKSTGRGLCIRITSSNFEEASLPQDIENWLGENNLNTEEIDLLVDFQIVDDRTSQQNIVRKINRIPRLNQWRTFIVALGAFPKDLSHLKKHDQYDIERADWKLWQNLLGSLQRRPCFADYTIQYPIYLPQNSAFNPSASIRYTLEDKWRVLRGEGLRNKKGAGFKQYPAQAKLLAIQKEFKGEKFSYGDLYIADKAKDIKTKKTGNPRSWLEAGINHHLTLVADQVSNLP